MAKSTLTVNFDGFKGIDLRKTHTGRPSCADMVNFRITSDGSLEKRCGYKSIFTFDKNVRGVWSGRLDGEFLCIAVVNSVVYLLDIDTDTSTTIGYLSTGSSAISFFFYRGILYLKDSIAFYKVSKSNVRQIYGYVPLYGKDWPDAIPGEINEPLNLLNRKARISYKIPNNNTLMLPTSEAVYKVHSLYRNGTLLSSSEYKIDTTYNTINVSSANPGDIFLANVEFKPSSNADINNAKLDFFTNTNTMVYGDMKLSRVFFWGNSNGSLVFTTTHVTSEAYAESEKYFSGHGALYVIPGNEFILGDGKNNIKAMTTHYDRLLIFTEGDVWMVDSSILQDQNTPIKAINSLAGCATSNGISLAGNDPVSIGKQTVFRWTSDTDEFSQCNAYSISDQINELLTPSFFQNAIVFNNIYNNELWFHDPTDDGTVWIYGIEKKYWFKYSNIPAKLFFDANGKVGFSDGNSIYVFDDELDADISSDGTKITIDAAFKSGILDFGESVNKRLLELEAVGELSPSSVRVTLTCNTGETLYSFPKGILKHCISKTKLHSGRFSTLTLSFTSAGNAGETIHSVKLTASKKK